ncbi:multiple epidermal growth factor-like domains protein 10 isoform X2 [Ostrea edulis]|uniref:multiple epidermal growth factor-like domains protein 10 isoform X2 n=1 Tax=Ostrea edulis TaxID=37623 RepID=UPI0024AEADFE|nr:multiple epidermal growth factor-like domains protein 10 isoform X2 [Ostrea edulis]
MVAIIFQILLCAIYTTAYDNLALWKLAWVQHNFPGKEVDWGAAKAVDGLYNDRSAGGNQCTLSNFGQTTTTWRVDLGSVIRISHINIYYRTDNYPSPGVYNNRFAGFFLYVSNSTTKDDGHLCFHEIQNVNGTPVENQTISCSVHGRYVIYYNERRPGVTYPSYYSRYAYNELCEVEVYACNKGLFGANCLHVCGHCAGNATCDHVNGSCPSGYCAPGWKHSSNGKCDQECDDGNFGYNCMLTCNGHCADRLPCSKTDGVCPGECMEGWTNPYCNEKCSRRSYGKACMERCGYCANNEPCNHINGTCPDSCEPGYKGEKCDEEADPRTSGFLCKSLCTNVCNAVCKKKIWN